MAHSGLLRRLHGALMPDYNRAAATYWWTMVLAGGVVIAGSLSESVMNSADLQLQILALCLASMAAGAFPVPIPGTKSSFAAAEIFIFLALLMFGVDAAALAAASEAFVASARTSKRWTSRLMSPAVAAISIVVTGAAFQSATGYLESRGLYGEGALIVVLSLLAFGYFVLTSWLVRLVLHLKSNEPLTLRTLVDRFGWIGTAYSANAFVAALLYLTSRQAGPAILLAAGPIIALLLSTLHFHFRQREAEAAEARARLQAAEREVAQAVGHNRELRRFAEHDGLTQLINRRFFLECLGKEFEHDSPAGSHPFAVMFLDFDRFKSINDTLGHAAGDDLLVHASNRILARVRSSDLVGRLGGDEFAILMTDIEEERQAIDLAERLLETLGRPYDVRGGTVSSNASIGITFSRYGYETPDAMLMDADAAMYEAKAMGGGHFVVYRPGSAPRPEAAPRLHQHA